MSTRRLRFANRLNERLVEAGFAPFSFVKPRPAVDNPQSEGQPEQQNNNVDWLEKWINSLELTFRGSISENPDVFLKRFTYRPSPSYPALAQRAGVHGVVLLQVKIMKDGHVEVQKVLEGEPVLADAAIDAVKRWHARPVWVQGKQCDVVSSVKFDFQLP